MLKFKNYQRFPLGVDFWRDILNKIAKNHIKIRKPPFLVQNSRGNWEKPIFWVVEEDLPSSPC